MNELLRLLGIAGVPIGIFMFGYGWYYFSRSEKPEMSTEINQKSFDAGYNYAEQEDACNNNKDL